MMSHHGIFQEESEGYSRFTSDSLSKLHRRKKDLKASKSIEKQSAAKQVILKGVSDSWTPELLEKNDHPTDPDPSLEDGQELPQYYGRFPKNLYSEIIEDVDSYYRDHGEETFCVVSKRFGKNCVYRFSATRSFFVFSPFNPLRQYAIRAILHPIFDVIVMAVILVNCVFLALDNEIANAEYVFTALYTMEMLIKITARGLIINPHSYLRDPWNWLDFVVVILAYATIADAANNVSSLRVFRVFRAFKSVSLVPGLKTIVNALFHSMKPLAEVMFIMVFLLIVISLIALQAYQGVLRRRCVRSPDTADGIEDDASWLTYVKNNSNWNPVEGEQVVCGNVTGSGICPTNFVCLPDVDDNPNFGYTNFDHMGYAMLTSFQLLTLDFWENVYNMIIRAEGPWNVLFFLMSVFLGPFYLLNLLLAVVTLAYKKEHVKQKQLEQMRTMAKERAQRRIKRRKKLQEQKQSFVKVENNGAVATQLEKVFAIAMSKPTTEEPSQLSSGLSDNLNYSKRVILPNDNMDLTLGRPGSFIDGYDSENESSKWQQQLHDLRNWFLSKTSWVCFPGFFWFQKRLFKVTSHKLFETLIMICIIMNTIFLAVDHHEISKELEDALDVGNNIFTAVFAIEALFKILSMGLINYLRDLWNLFDLIIVLISIVELFLFIIEPNTTGTNLTVLRTLRLLRVFRLARMWETMHKLVSIIWKSIGAVSYLTIVLFLILYIFAVIGKQLYSNQYQNSQDKFDDFQIPRWNFVDFYHSFLLVWRVMCGEWVEPLYDCLHITNDGFCIPFFLSITFVANFMILNLFTAILLEAFNVDNIQGKDESQKKVATNHEKKGDEKSNLHVNNVLNSKDTPNTAESDQLKAQGETNEFLPESDLQKEKYPRQYDFGVQADSILEKNCIGRSLFVESNESLEGLNSSGTDSITEKIKHSNATCLDKELIDVRRVDFISETQKVDQSKDKISKHHYAKLGSSVKPNAEDAVMNISQHSLSKTPSNKDSQKASYPPDCLPRWFINRYPYVNNTPQTKLCDFWQCVRKACFSLVEHEYFEGFILFLILASTISLAMEDISLENDPIRKNVLQKLEYVFTALFTLEMLLKWIGLGPTKYFTSFWCALDSAIVAASWAGIILQATSQASQTGGFRSLRTLRALRPLRAVSRWEGMRVVVNALIYCIPSIANVLCVCFLIWFVFGIMGVQFFKGRFARCVDADDNVVNSSMVKNRLECADQNLTWINPNINFDHVLNAMVALFQVATFEGWIEIMADASDVVGVYQQPRREASQYYLIFFVFFVLIGSFFILNLIVGVIIESFQKLSKQTESTSAVETLLTDTQKNFLKTMRTMLNRKPKKSIPPPEGRWQIYAFDLVTHSRFELAVFLLIVMNMITLSMEHYQMSEQWISALRITDITFTVLFSLEAALKLIGMRHYYFRDVFNVFDFIVILVSITGFILENLVALIVSPTLLRVVRVFRVFRVLRVVRAARGIRRLVLTLMISIPALFNIAVLLGVFIVIFAILGMTLFMNVKLNGALNDQVNFRTFGNSLLVLFRLVTSAGWNDVLDPLMNVRNCELSNGISPGNCGDPVLAVLYFVLFIFVVFLVIVNMYIAIILENFDEIFEQDESGVSQGDFESFYVIWGRYDPRATQFVTLTELSNLLHDLHPPFQLPKPNSVKIGALDLPILYGDKVHCLDVLFALVKRILGDVEISDDMKKEAEVRLLKSFPNRKTLKAETTTLVLRQQIRAAKVIQDAWRTFKAKRLRINRKYDADKTENEIEKELKTNFAVMGQSDFVIENPYVTTSDVSSVRPTKERPKTSVETKLKENSRRVSSAVSGVKSYTQGNANTPKTTNYSTLQTAVDGSLFQTRSPTGNIVELKQFLPSTLASEDDLHDYTSSM